MSDFLSKNKLFIGVGLAVGVLAIVYINRVKLKKLGLAAGSKITDFKNSLANSISTEYNKWNSGGKKTEADPSMFSTLQEYFDSTGAKFSTEQQKSLAWSAAFISYNMKKSGAGSDFPYSPSHSVYIRKTIQNRKLNNANPFKAYKPDEVPVSVGDLVCYPRQSGVTYDTTTDYNSHCDLVSSVSNGVAVGVGGNVGNSVSKTNIILDSTGKVDKSKNSNPIFVIIKNKK